MNRLAMAAVLCALAGVLFTPVRAQEPAQADDVRAGRALSLKLCTACHLVLPNQEMMPLLRPPAPAFRAIANRPGVTADSLRRFLSETHSSIRSTKDMPNPELTEDQTRQAVAFLMSLRSRR